MIARNSGLFIKRVDLYFNDTKAWNVISDYSVKKDSSETIEFYEIYKDLIYKTPFDRKLFNNLYENYIKVNSSNEVNLMANTRNNLELLKQDLDNNIPDHEIPDIHINALHIAANEIAQEINNQIVVCLNLK